MTDSEKPEGTIEDADGVVVDEDGEVKMEMERIELADGEESSQE